MSRSDTERALVDVLLRWYEEHGRHGFPWRGASPFEVLVAEFMLQRTFAERVLGVFEPFVERYPDARSVAGAPVEELEDVLAPLGLRKRARFLKRTSESLVRRHGGDVPNERNELLELHGVGECTAASVLAHAYGKDAAAVDTNVARILSRTFAPGGIDASRAAETRKLVERLSPSGRSGDFLHALIDFGAAICTASDPDCRNCQVNGIRAYAIDRKK